MPRWRDIRSVTKESFTKKTGLQTVDLISGGFPCQPFSVAGKQRGKEDDRYLWPQMLRVIKEIRPTWVLGENVAGIVRMALDQVLSDLENQGYTTIPFIIPACGVNAPHRRERVFILAHSECAKRWQGKPARDDPNWENARWPKTTGGIRTSSQNGRADDVANPEYEGRDQAQEHRESTKNDRRPQEQKEKTQQPSGDYIMADPQCYRCERQGSTEHKGQTNKFIHGSTELPKPETWLIEPDVGRVAHGVPARVDRLKCLGNAVVPQQVYPILAAIAKIERSNSLFR